MENMFLNVLKRFHRGTCTYIHTYIHTYIDVHVYPFINCFKFSFKVKLK